MKRLLIPVAVIFERVESGHPWQQHQWRACGLVLDPPPGIHGKVRARSPGRTEYFAACDPIELHAKEAEGYAVNLRSARPCAWVIVDTDNPDAQDPLPVSVQLVTVSAFDAQEYLDPGELDVDVVPMPVELHSLVEAFVAAQPSPAPFRKRRNRKPNIEEYRFGQEPLAVLRQRMGREREKP